MHINRRDGAWRRSVPRLAAAVAAALLMIALPGSAAAHAELVTSTPADGEILATAPAEVVLTFSEAPGPRSSAAVLDGTGATIATGGPDSSDATVIRVALPVLAPGAYEVQWTTVAEDGHIERGTFSFSVAESTAPPATAPPASTDRPTVAPLATDEPAPSEAPTDLVIAPAPSAAGGSTGSGGMDVLLPILAVVILVGGGFAVMLRRRGAA